MMVTFCPLASGSKGNCVFLGTDHTKILIDVGISARSIQQKLHQLGCNLDQIDAIVITHDHADHIIGLRTLTKKLPIPVVCNLATAQGIAQYLGKSPRCKIFQTGENFEIGQLLLHPFSIQHDTGDPVGFTVETLCNNQVIKVGICTDLGFATGLVADRLKGCDCLYIEANHDPDLVFSSLRPQIYKQRVLGRMGHLSNESCARLVCEVAHQQLQRVYLAHLSQECNREELAIQTVLKGLPQPFQNLELLTAKQFEMSEKMILTGKLKAMISVPSLQTPPSNHPPLSVSKSADLPLFSNALPTLG